MEPADSDATRLIRSATDAVRCARASADTNSSTRPPTAAAVDLERPLMPVAPLSSLPRVPANSKPVSLCGCAALLFTRRSAKRDGAPFFAGLTANGPWQKSRGLRDREQLGHRDSKAQRFVKASLSLGDSVADFSVPRSPWGLPPRGASAAGLRNHSRIPKP